MDTIALARRISLPEETISALRHVALPEHHAALRTMFWEARAAFEQYARQTDGLTLLQLYLHWLPDMRARYRQKGIPEEIFRDNCKDMAIWCQDCLDKTGRPGLEKWSWVGHSLRMELIRLGRLQFEPRTLEEPIACGECLVPAGTPVLEVHIPAGEPLDPQEVRRSLERAPAFFQQYFDQAYRLYHCHSWLLSPDLKALLPEHARILQFQSMFRIYAQFDERQAEERVFGTVSDDTAAYPENTSLQRALKRHLLSGHKVRVGAGILPL